MGASLNCFEAVVEESAADNHNGGEDQFAELFLGNEVDNRFSD